MRNIAVYFSGRAGSDRMKLAGKERGEGFTLIELLVVIAIIGILAAIILPVYSQAKKSAYRSADMSNMNQLRTALQLYRVDQGAYPPSLLGYVTQYAGGPNPTTSDFLPANLVKGALYPKRVNSLSTFQPALDRGNGTTLNDEFQNPYWPNGNVGTSVGQQRYGSTTLVGHCDSASTDYPNLTPSNFYTLSGYDMGYVNSPTGMRYELHYAPFWSVSTTPSTCSPVDVTGDPNDAPNQLGYTDPPETTVVTWDSFFRDYDSTTGTPLHERQDIVLFLAGDARPYDSAVVAQKAWQVTP